MSNLLKETELDFQVTSNDNTTDISYIVITRLSSYYKWIRQRYNLNEQNEERATALLLKDAKRSLNEMKGNYCFIIFRITRNIN